MPDFSVDPESIRNAGSNIAAYATAAPQADLPGASDADDAQLPATLTAIDEWRILAYRMATGGTSELGDGATSAANAYTEADQNAAGVMNGAQDTSTPPPSPFRTENTPAAPTEPNNPAPDPAPNTPATGSSEQIVGMHAEGTDASGQAVPDGSAVGQFTPEQGNGVDPSGQVLPITPDSAAVGQFVPVQGLADPSGLVLLDGTGVTSGQADFTAAPLAPVTPITPLAPVRPSAGQLLRRAE